MGKQYLQCVKRFEGQVTWENKPIKDFIWVTDVAGCQSWASEGIQSRLTLVLAPVWRPANAASESSCGGKSWRGLSLPSHWAEGGFSSHVSLGSLYFRLSSSWQQSTCAWLPLSFFPLVEALCALSFETNLHKWVKRLIAIPSIHGSKCWVSVARVCPHLPDAIAHCRNAGCKLERALIVRRYYERYDRHISPNLCHLARENVEVQDIGRSGSLLSPDFLAITVACLIDVIVSSTSSSEIPMRCLAFSHCAAKWSRNLLSTSFQWSMGLGLVRRGNAHNLTQRSFLHKLVLFSDSICEDIVCTYF